MLVLYYQYQNRRGNFFYDKFAIKIVRGSKRKKS